MKKSFIFLCVLTTMITASDKYKGFTTNPSSFYKFFYKQQDGYLPAGNYLVIQDTDENKEYCKFACYTMKEKEKKDIKNRYEYESTSEAFYVFSKTLLSNKYQKYTRVKEVMLPMNHIGAFAEIVRDRGCYIRREGYNYDARLCKVTKDIPITDTVFDKTKVALTIIGACVIGFFTKSYFQSSTKSN